MGNYIAKTKYHCGIDLHKCMSYICVMNTQGKILVHMKIDNNDFNYMKKVLTPYWNDLTIACESTFNWYILADFCALEKIDFALGHAFYMRLIHGSKAKNDKIDSRKIADLLRTNLLPEAYACPQKFRAHRDLLRRRVKLLNLRSGVSTYISLFENQNGLNSSSPDLRRTVKSPQQLMSLQTFAENDKAMACNYQLNSSFLVTFSKYLDQVDKQLLKFTLDSTFCDDYKIVSSMKGIGPVLGMTLVYETHDIRRFKNAGKYASYCRVIKCKKESAGKNYGSSGVNNGNPHLKWAFGQIAILAQKEPLVKLLAQELEKRHGKRKARSVLTHKICRSIYYMLLHRKPFDLIDFLGKEKYVRLKQKIH